MTLNRDEQAVRDLLGSLAAGQPEPPASRLAGVRGRVSARRRHRALAAGVAGAAAVAAVIAGFTLPGGPAGGAASGSRHVPAWALPWPDHRSSDVSQRVLDGAVLAWRHFDGIPADQDGQPLPGPAKVIWYAGQRADAGQDVVAVFEVDGPAGPRLVLAISQAQDVLHGQPGWSGGSSPWRVFSVPAPDPAQPGLEISAYLFSALNVYDNTLFVLTAPDVSTITYNISEPARVIPSGNLGVEAENGLAVADLGRLAGRAQLTGLLTGHGNALSKPVYVGLPGSFDSEVPALEPPAQPVLPRPFRAFGGFTTSGHGTDENPLPKLRPGERAVIIGRCYGPGVVTFRLSKDALSGGRVGAIRCDDAQHELPIPASALGHGRLLQVSGGPLTMYSVTWGAVRG
jgi:hypothetical protein